MSEVTERRVHASRKKDAPSAVVGTVRKWCRNYVAGLEESSTSEVLRLQTFCRHNYVSWKPERTRICRGKFLRRGKIIRAGMTKISVTVNFSKIDNYLLNSIKNVKPKSTKYVLIFFNCWPRHQLVNNCHRVQQENCSIVLHSISQTN